MSTSTAEHAEVEFFVSFSKLVALQLSLPGWKNFSRTARKKSRVLSKLFNLNLFCQCNYFLSFQRPSLQSTGLLKTKLSGERPVCLCDWVQTPNSFFLFKKYDAHFHYRQYLCSHCVQVCSAEGSSIFLLLGNLVHNFSVNAELILRLLLKHRDFSDQFKKCVMGVGEITEGDVSQKDFCAQIL